MRDEAELIRAAAAGDRAAFDDLVRIKRERVARIAFQVTGDWDDALDVAQGVFFKLWRGLGRFDPRRRFDTWLHRITVNAAIDLVRAQGPKGTLQPLPDDADRLPAAQGGAGAAAEAADLAELQRAFLRLAARLAVKQRTAFVLREIEGLETAEVARIMGVTESTVRNHLLQARRTLRDGIVRDYPGLVPRSARAGEDEEVG
jgi:RNA polymerase sigma-70 factor (ECF subfamily)